MRGTHYAHALQEILKSSPKDEDTLLKNFAGTVVANGHAHLFPKIIKSFERMLAKDVKAGTIEVTSAKPLAQEEVAALLKKEPFKNALSVSHKRVERKVDDGIIGGIVVRTGTTRIDGSYKRALLDLYQSLIST